MSKCLAVIMHHPIKKAFPQVEYACFNLNKQAFWCCTMSALLNNNNIIRFLRLFFACRLSACFLGGSIEVLIPPGVFFI